MKNIFYTILLVLPLLVSCKQQHAIVGNIIGLGNDTVFVSRYPMYKFPDSDIDALLDTIIAKNDKFYYDILQDREQVISLHLRRMPEFWEEEARFFQATGNIRIAYKAGDKIKIKGKVEPKYLYYEAKGNTFSEKYSHMRLSCMKELIKLDSINHILDEHSKLPSSEDVDNNILKLFEERDRISRAEEEKVMAYIKSNLSTDLGVYFILRQPLDTFAIYHEQINDKMRKGFFKDWINDKTYWMGAYMKYQQNKENRQKGKIIHDITLEDIHGNNFSLYSLKGKWVVLDIWGSWCTPCIKGIPKMKKYYEKYTDKVEFVGIHWGQDETEWKEALKENKITWMQLNGYSGIPVNNVLDIYAIEDIPTKIILDKNMKIVAIFAGETEDFYKKMDELFQ